MIDEEEKKHSYAKNLKFKGTVKFVVTYAYYKTRHVFRRWNFYLEILNKIVLLALESKWIDKFSDRQHLSAHLFKEYQKYLSCSILQAWEPS